MLALCLAASLDTFLWNQSRERESAESYQEEANARARSVSFAVSELRRSSQTQAALADAAMIKLRELEQKASKVCQSALGGTAKSSAVLERL